MKHPLVELRDHAEWALVEALNASTGHERSLGEVESLRDRLQEACKACIEAGLDGRTFMEQVAENTLERRRADTEHVRSYAAEQATLPGKLTRRTRLSTSLLIAIIAGTFLLTMASSVAHMILSFLGAALVFMAANALMATRFPTAAIRVGNMCADLDVDIRDLYPVDTADRSDYLWAMSIRRWHNARRGAYSTMLRYR